MSPIKLLFFYNPHPYIFIEMDHQYLPTYCSYLPREERNYSFHAAKQKEQADSNREKDYTFLPAPAAAEREINRRFYFLLIMYKKCCESLQKLCVVSTALTSISENANAPLCLHSTGHSSTARLLVDIRYKGLPFAFAFALIFIPFFRISR